MAGAHDALADVVGTLDALRGQLRTGALPDTVATLHALQWPWPEGALDPEGKLIYRDGAARLTFGKWNGVPLAQVRPDYFQFILDKDFSSEVKALVRRHLAGETLGPRVSHVLDLCQRCRRAYAVRNGVCHYCERHQ